MKKVEEIKNKRQAQFIYDRWKKAKEIEKQKDIKEVSYGAAVNVEGPLRSKKKNLLLILIISIHRSNAISL